MTRRSLISAPDCNSLILPAIDPLAPLARQFWQAQPRAVRIFNPALEVLLDNAPDRVQRYPLYRDGGGQPLAIPPPGAARNGWPVARTLATGEPTARNYWVRLPDADACEACFRVRAWRLDPTSDLVVEETERIDKALCHDERLKNLDRELGAMIHRVVEFMLRRSPAEALRLRLTNANLQPCHEIRRCGRTRCPAHGHPASVRCWELEGTLCEAGMEYQNQLDKFRHCESCEAFLMACPDPLTRVGENFNRLLSLLELKHQESLEAQAQLQQSEKLALIGELMLGLAHEIKTPLSVIMGRLDCLMLELDEQATGGLGEDLDVLRGQAGRMRALLDNILNLARPEPPRLRPLELAEPVEQVLAVTRKTLEKAAVTVRARVAPGLRIQGDPLQLQQVLLNLVINARDAMPGGGRIEIGARREGRAATAGIQLWIADSGPGIATDKLEQIFSPFYSTKVQAGGTGLGLAICRRILALHGGRISARNGSRRGAVFTLCFPPAKE